MIIRKDAIEQSLDHLRRCLCIVKDFNGKVTKIVITSESIKLINTEVIIPPKANDIAKHLHSMMEAYYDEP